MGGWINQMLSDKPYADQFKDLFEEATNKLGYKFILSLQVFDKPRDDEGSTNYPYIGYNMLSSRQVANIQREEQKDSEVRKWWEEQFEFTISFTAVAKDPFESTEVATQFYNWLKNTGAGWLMYKQIVHVASTPIQTRDYFMVNDYERRTGFDARLRFGRIAELVVPRIERVNVQPGTIL